jgi:hypothetical protein
MRGIPSPCLKGSSCPFQQVTASAYPIVGGPTTPGLRLDGPLVVLDLAAVYHSPALGVLMACAAAWLQSAIRAQHRNRIIVVVDEAWAILSNLRIPHIGGSSRVRIGMREPEG